MTADNAPC